jgi:hypothetical protein
MQATQKLATFDITGITKTVYCVEHKGSFSGEWYPVLGFETLELAQAYADNGPERRVTTFALILSQKA